MARVGANHGRVGQRLHRPGRALLIAGSSVRRELRWAVTTPMLAPAIPNALHQTSPGNRPKPLCLSIPPSRSQEDGSEAGTVHNKSELFWGKCVYGHFFTCGQGASDNLCQPGNGRERSADGGAFALWRSDAGVGRSRSSGPLRDSPGDGGRGTGRRERGWSRRGGAGRTGRA